ncbi:TPA: hypothetical protein KEW82_003967 [Citrobacter amalonaticus]|nr:hypothetical protein [Citrobacter amalonaticus]
MAKAWSLDPALFADKVEEDVGKLQRVIAIQLLNEIVIRSPVGNPEIWAINSMQVQQRDRVNDINEALRSSDRFGTTDKNGNRRIKRGNKVSLAGAEYSSNAGKFGPQRVRKLRRGQGEIYRPPGYRAGTFRASHFVSVGSPSDYVPREPDPNGANTINNGTSTILAAPSYSVIYIQSNLPYSVPLENGHSKQAPTGVYAVSFNGVTQAYK